MASLNLSTNGSSISKSYQSVVNAPPPTGPAAASPTYGQWAVFSVSAPLVNAFQQDAGNKESVLKVQSTGEGELVDLIDEFSDGRTQFAYVKVKDSNTGLPKNALIGWCGEGVPERTKGYFTSHLAAVARLLHGYHVQITARSDRDLTPESIVQKIADSSGSKYSTSGAPPELATSTKPSVAAKPAFTPTRSSGGSSGYSLPTRNRGPLQKDVNVDEDGWGHDAPPVTRTQLEKVAPAYQPTKVDMRSLTSSGQNPSSLNGSGDAADDRPGVVRGAYQPHGKIDIAAIRRQAKEAGELKDDRPEIVKGSYEPVGKVDIAAIRARAQQPKESSSVASKDTTSAPDGDGEGYRPISERSTAFTQSERLTSLPKPKVSNRFGGGATFTGTKAPTPGGFETRPAPAAVPVGAASRTFADQGGKTPAQLWAEKKARERGTSGSGESMPSAYNMAPSPITSQTSGGGGWKSGYSGKSWAPVQTTHTGGSAGASIAQQQTGDEEIAQEEEVGQSPAGGVSSIRDRFSGAPPMGAPSTAYDRPAPEPDVSNKPNRGIGIPVPGMMPNVTSDEDENASRLPPPPARPREPTPPTPEIRNSSPIRVAVPVSRGAVTDAREEQISPPTAMPVKSMAEVLPEPDDDEPETGPDPARTAAQTTAATTHGAAAVETAHLGAQVGGKRALVQYDYEKAEENEIELKEGEYVTNIEMVDEDWWMGQNVHGETGLFPSNYVELVHEEGGQHSEPAAHGAQHTEPVPAAPTAAAASSPKAGPTATAQYDYEAAEDNEIGFPEGAKITNLEFPDEDWWLGEYGGKSGLFPANYVQLDE